MKIFNFGWTISPFNFQIKRKIKINSLNNIINSKRVYLLFRSDFNLSNNLASNLYLVVRLKELKHRNEN